MLRSAFYYGFFVALSVAIHLAVIRPRFEAEAPPPPDERAVEIAALVEEMAELSGEILKAQEEVAQAAEELVDKAPEPKPEPEPLAQKPPEPEPEKEREPGPEVERYKQHSLEQQARIDKLEEELKKRREEEKQERAELMAQLEQLRREREEARAAQAERERQRDERLRELARAQEEAEARAEQEAKRRADAEQIARALKAGADAARREHQQDLAELERQKQQAAAQAERERSQRVAAERFAQQLRAAKDRQERELLERLNQLEDYDQYLLATKDRPIDENTVPPLRLQDRGTVRDTADLMRYFGMQIVVFPRDTKRFALRYDLLADELTPLDNEWFRSYANRTIRQDQFQHLAAKVAVRYAAVNERVEVHSFYPVATANYFAFRQIQAFRKHGIDPRTVRACDGYYRKQPNGKWEIVISGAVLMNGQAVSLE